MSTSTRPDATLGVIGRAIIIGMSSDIGTALASRWHAAGWTVSGTYRTPTPAIAALERRRIQAVPCDLARPDDVASATTALMRGQAPWDALVLAPGLLEPIGPFAETDFNAWESSLAVNLTTQLRVLRSLLEHRNKDGSPLVLFFAGGGTNSAPHNYSAYTVSKIALIKMCELLDAEIPDTRFTILGPGWVRTKIHEATLDAGADAGTAFDETQKRLDRDDFVPMERVLDCIDWAAHAPRAAISGRNISVAHDAWGESWLEQALIEDPHMYKLRRSGNHLTPPPPHAQGPEP